jgi:PAS domain S-box-containing protein
LPDQASATILYVDDDEDDRRLLGRVFREAGFRVLEAATGGDALRLCHEQPDVVVLDVRLPDISGFEVCRRIKTNPATGLIPVLHLSAAHVSSGDRVQGLQRGADSYLVKPVDPHELLASVHALLRIRRTEEALRQAEERYRSIFENAVEGIFQTTPDGRFLTANPALARMLGFASAPEMIDAVTDIGRELYASPEARAEWRRTLEEHGWVHGFECEARRRDGQLFWASLSGRAVRDARGEVRYFEGIIEDITKRKHAEAALLQRVAQQAAVAELGRRALATTRLPALLEEAVVVVARTLGVEYGALFELSADGRDLLLRAGVGWQDDRVGRATVGTAERSQPGFCLLTQGPVIVEDLAREVRFQPTQLLLDHGAVSSLAVIVHGDDEPVGVLMAASTRRRAFSQDDVHFVQAVANVVAAAIERSRAEEERLTRQAEQRVAQKIQRKLFPSPQLQLCGTESAGHRYRFDIGGASYPAEATGGDYFDYVPMPDGSVGIVVGDVSGHAFGSALLMAEARAFLRALARTRTDVTEILALANQLLAGDVEDRFITLLFARLDPPTRSFVYSSAGHLTGYILDASGAVKRTLPSTGLPLGAFPECSFPAGPATTLEAGDLVLLFTDGVVEALCPDNTVFGVERALDIVRAYRDTSARQVVDNLYHAARVFAHNSPQLDDITAVVIKVEQAP